LSAIGYKYSKVVLKEIRC